MRSHLLLAGPCLLLLTAGVLAQGVLLPEREIAGTPWVVPPGTLPLACSRQQVTASLRDGAATVVVEQTFHNQFNHRLEGTFLFPLPEGAAVSDFAMSINGQLISAELLDAAKAKAVYEEIVRRQKDPGLLEYLGRNCFRARIFPIEPGEAKKIKLEYTQAIGLDNGLAQFVFPLRSRAFDQQPVRPMPLPHPVRDPRLQLELRPDAPVPGRVGQLGVEVNIESSTAIKSVYSPTFDIDVKRDGEKRVKVGYEASNVVPDEDFQLYYQLSDASFGLNLLTWRGTAEDGYFMALLAPKSELRESEVQPKDIVFVCDTSGSMSGPKIQQARNALTYCLQNLNPSDRFNVIAFSTAVEAFAEQLVPADAAQRGAAAKFVAALPARGGTNIDEALKAAAGLLRKDPQRPQMILFLTDGQPTVGVTDALRILENCSKANVADARMFVFGVGDDLNAMLLDRLSNDNRGTRTYVKPQEDIEVAVSNLYAKITSPVLSDLKLQFDGVKVSELYPLALPDLFRGSQITLLGRYSGDGPVKVSLSGTANGQEQRFDYSADFPRRNRENSFIPRLWATRRIGYLLDQIRLHGQDKELVEEVVRLATRHGILTPYTSYLVLEPGQTADTAALDALQRGRAQVQMGGAGGAMGAPGSPAPASRPTDLAAGAEAVRRSDGETKLRDASQAARSDAYQTRQAGARTFYQVDQTWIESTYPKEPGKQLLVKVKYGSAAWSELLTLRREMREILSVGSRVQAVVGTTLLVVDEESGDEKLSDSQRTALRE
ncbi:MAG: VWA domain-containing protein [Fimbriimonadaceae bacterium]|nr:VWA domain-containing protein [Fimbriimonadaceae bacterium]